MSSQAKISLVSLHGKNPHRETHRPCSPCRTTVTIGETTCWLGIQRARTPIGCPGVGLCTDFVGQGHAGTCLRHGRLTPKPPHHVTAGSRARLLTRGRSPQTCWAPVRSARGPPAAVAVRLCTGHVMATLVADNPVVPSKPSPRVAQTLPLEPVALQPIQTHRWGPRAALVWLSAPAQYPAMGRSLPRPPHGDDPKWPPSDAPARAGCNLTPESDSPGSVCPPRNALCPIGAQEQPRFRKFRVFKPKILACRFFFDLTQTRPGLALAARQRRVPSSGHGARVGSLAAPFL